MAGDGSQANPRVLGLTGPIACGKTTVGDILLQLGARERIDADRIVHGLLAPGTAANEAVAARFGQAVLRPDGGVDRARLGAIVFADREALRALEELTHPAVRAAVRERLASLADTGGIAIVDAVKLLQSDLLPLCDAVWVIRCATGEQRRRLRTDRGMSDTAAAARLAAQPDFEHPAVTRTIDNSGSRETLVARVTAAWDEQLASWEAEQR